MTLAELIAQVRVSVGNPTTTDVPDATLQGMINFAYKEVADKFRFHKTRRICEFTTQAGVDKYTLPAGTNLVFRVKNKTSDWGMDKLPDNLFEMEITPASPQGAPTHFARYRDYVKLHPVPDGEYVIEVFYQFGVTSMTQPTDEPVIPEAWHVGIVRLARHYYYDFVKGDQPKAIAALNMYRNWLADKPVEVHEEVAQGDHGVIITALARDARGEDDG